MNLEAFSVVVAFLAVVEFALGAAALLLGLREARRPAGESAEERRPLMALVAGALLAVAIASCPLFYLLLASWVPRWPGIMCVEGVRRIGTGTVGAARWLPGLVAALDWTKLLAIFAAGAWAILRRAHGAPAARRAAFAAMALGLVASCDGAVEFAYVAIPKEEVFPSAGCCTVAAAGVGLASDATEAGAPDDAGRAGRLSAGFISFAAVLGIGSAALARRGAAGPGTTAALALLAVLAAASLPAAARFLADAAAPVLLGLPHHRCAWCALARAPEAVAGTILHVGAALAAGWALVARLSTGRAGESARILLWAASFGFLGTAAMATVVVCFP
jgi:hypothetical protein